jgi:hypothetical protein
MQVPRKGFQNSAQGRPRSGRTLGHGSPNCANPERVPQRRFRLTLRRPRKVGRPFTVACAAFRYPRVRSRCSRCWAGLSIPCGKGSNRLRSQSRTWSYRSRGLIRRFRVSRGSREFARGAQIQVVGSTETMKDVCKTHLSDLRALRGEHPIDPRLFTKGHKRASAVRVLRLRLSLPRTTSHRQRLICRMSSALGISWRFRCVVVPLWLNPIVISGSAA